jgi:hypothetical protein
MRLSELKGYRSEPLYDILSNSLNITEFIENLKQSGYKKYLIGEGFYAGVFSRPTDNYVIKIFENDPGYEKFIKYVLSNRDNPHVPKIKSKPIRFLKKYKILRIEKLQKLDKNNEQQMEIYKSIVNYISDYGKDYKYAVINRKKLQKQFPKLIPILNELQSNKYLLDLSHNNIMFRNQNTPVITDPYADFI